MSHFDAWSMCHRLNHLLLGSRKQKLAFAIVELNKKRAITSAVIIPTTSFVITE
jgi:hypothetical protein